MRHEKILKREDGSRIKIVVNLTIEYYRKEPGWSINTARCEPRKRTWENVVDNDSYTYRRLSIDQQNEFDLQETYKHVTPDELLAVKLELWEKIKPQ